MSQQACAPGTKPPWSSPIFLLVRCWIQCADARSQGRGSVAFSRCPSGLGNGVMLASQDESGSVPSFTFWKGLCARCDFFLKYGVEVSSTVLWVWKVLWEKVFDHKFNFVSDSGLLRLLISSRVNLSNRSFKELVYFIQVSSWPRAFRLTMRFYIFKDGKIRAYSIKSAKKKVRGPRVPYVILNASSPYCLGLYPKRVLSLIYVVSCTGLK